MSDVGHVAFYSLRAITSTSYSGPQPGGFGVKECFQESLKKTPQNIKIGNFFCLQLTTNCWDGQHTRAQPRTRMQQPGMELGCIWRGFRVDLQLSEGNEWDARLGNPLGSFFSPMAECSTGWKMRYVHYSALFVDLAAVRLNRKILI